MSSLEATVSLLLSLTLAITKGIPFKGHSLELPCLLRRVCTLAFITDNPVILYCPHATLRHSITWQYLDLAQTDRQPVTFLRSGTIFQPTLSQDNLHWLQLKSRLVFGNLYISSPSSGDSGLYTCRMGNFTLAYYQVDFQDADSIHVAHAILGETTLGNATADLGNGTQAVLFTAWSSWQPCDHCDGTGERKRIGFCYARVTPGKEHEMEELLPCGLARKRHPTLPSRGPELRVEACRVASSESCLQAEEVPLLVYATYHPNIQRTTYLRCPTSSIYSPVYWQQGNTTLSFLQNLRQNSSSHRLDKGTGGGILRISSMNQTERRLYQCYVDGRLVGKFLVTAPNTWLPAGKLANTYSIIDAVIVGISIFLIFLMFLTIVHSCRKKPVTAMV